MSFAASGQNNFPQWSSSTRQGTTKAISSTSSALDTGAVGAGCTSSAKWRFLLIPQLKEIVELGQLEDNWDGYGCAAASAEAVASSSEFLKRFYDAYSRSGRYRMPFITCNEYREVVFEWWAHTRKLTIYFNGTTIRYLKSWGPDMDAEMSDGVLERPRMADSLWIWLINGL